MTAAVKVLGKERPGPPSTGAFVEGGGFLFFFMAFLQDRNFVSDENEQLLMPQMLVMQKVSKVSGCS